MNSFRQILIKLRGGDFVHPGGKDAIDFVLAKALELSPEIKSGPCLDVGSGPGGTAAYLSELNFKSIHGIDLDEAAVNYARKHYPQIQFTAADALQVSELFEPNSFSFIYMFNVLYAIEEKLALLRQLSRVAKPGALLAIFDYTTSSPSNMKDLVDRPMHPIVLEQFKEESDWKVVEITDLSNHFITWYQELLNKLNIERATLLRQFSEADISRVHSTISSLIAHLKSGQMGGAVIYLKRQP